jgi:hypothetical protein
MSSASLCVFLAAVSPVRPAESSGSSYKSCGIFLDFDKYVFDGGQTVPIRIETTCDVLFPRTVRVMVSDAEQTVEESDYATTDKGQIYLDKQLEILEGVTEVTFEPPENDGFVYRYLVTLKHSSGETLGQTLIFTKDGADTILLHDVDLPPAASAGSDLKISAALSDGLGRPPSSIARVWAVLQRPVCNAGEYSANALEFELERKSATSNSSIYEGSIQIPPGFPSGSYNVVVSAPYTSGYRSVEESKRVSIDGEASSVTTLFHDIKVARTNMFSTPNRPTFSPGEDIVLTGRALSDDCLPLSGIEITGSFFGLPTPIILSKDTTDDAGNFILHFQTYPQLQYGFYEINAEADYLNQTFSTARTEYRNMMAAHLADIQKFEFEVNGKRATAETMSSGAGRVVSLDLDSNSKTLSVVLEGKPRSRVQYELALPSELISGDMVVSINGSEEIRFPETWGDASYYGPDVEQEGGYLGPSYTLLANRYGTGDAYFSFVSDEGGRTQIEILGTNVVPEFGGSALTLGAAVVVIASVVILITKANDRWNL